MRLLICLILSGWTATAPGALTNRFPVKQAADQAQAYAAFNQAPLDSVTTLVDALSSTQAAERVAAEYALDGWTTYSLRPNADTGERVVLESALVAHVATATTGSAWNATGAFLIGQLGKVGTQRSVKTLCELLHKEAWAQDAALALQSFALPAHARWVAKTATSVLAKSERHRDVLLYLLDYAEVQSLEPRSQALAASRKAIAAYQPGEPGHKVCSALVTLADELGDAAFPEIASAMDHPDPAVRGTARRLVSASGSTQVSPWLLSRLEEGDPEVRAEALVLLTQRKDPDVFPPAQALLNDDSEAIRRAAYDACAALGEADVVDDLLAVYVPAIKGDRSALLAALLHRQGVAIADRAHAELLASSDPRVREAMLEVMGACMARDYVNDALVAIRAEDEDLAKQGVKTVQRLAVWEQAQALIDLLRDPGLDPTLRSSLVPALVAALNDAAEEGDRIDPVKTVLAETQGSVRQDLYRVLSGLRAAEAVTLLKEGTSDADAAHRDSAVRALCVWQGYAAAAPLLDVARSTTNETHHTLALRRVVQLVQQRAPADTKDEELRDEARRLYETALTVAFRDEERTMIQEALDGLTPEPESPDAGTEP